MEHFKCQLLCEITSALESNVSFCGGGGEGGNPSGNSPKGTISIGGGGAGAM